MKKSVLLYHLYPKSYWKELTLKLLSNIPHNDIFIHVSLDWMDKLFRQKQIRKFLLQIPKVKEIYFSDNDKKLGEVIGFNLLKTKIDFTSFSLLTYMHSKGVTKPDNKNISDWVELMRYFQMDKFDLCKKAFSEGYCLYGVKLAKYNGGERMLAYKHCDYWYGGNFVSCNLDLLREKFISTPIAKDYYGLEGFWGNLCPVEKAYSAHETGSLYDTPYPEHLYKDQHLNME